MSIIKLDDQNSDNPSTTGADFSSPMQGSSQSNGNKPQSLGTGHFTDINKYLNANKSSAGNMANSIVGTVQNKADSIRSDINSAGQNFNKSIQGESSRLANGEDFINNSINQVNQGQHLNQENLQKFSDYRLGNGENLQTQVNLPGIQQKAHDVASFGNLANTESGRKQLLTNTFASPSYTSGQKRFDQLLLQGSPDAANTLVTGVNKATSGIDETAQKELDSETNKLAELNARKAAIQNIVSGQLQSAQDQIKTDVLRKGEDYNSRLQANAALLSQQLGQGYLTKDVYDQLDPDTKAIFDQIQKKNLSTKSISGLADVAGTVQPTLYDFSHGVNADLAAKFATPDIVNRQRALEELAGTGPTYLEGGNRNSSGYSAQELGLGDIQQALSTRDSSYAQARDAMVSKSAQDLSDQIYNAYGKGVGMGDVNNNEIGNELRTAYGKSNLAKLLGSGVAQDPSLSVSVTKDQNQDLYNLGTPIAQTTSNGHQAFGSGFTNNVDLGKYLAPEYQAKLNALQALKDQYYSNPFKILDQAPAANKIVTK
jgi:hypothetical protein